MQSVPVVARAGVAGSPVTPLFCRSLILPIPARIPQATAMRSMTPSHASASAADVRAAKAADSHRKASSMPKQLLLRQVMFRARPSRNLRMKSAGPAVANTHIVARRAGPWFPPMRPNPLPVKTVGHLPHMLRLRRIIRGALTDGRKAITGTLGMTSAPTCMRRLISAPTIAAC